MYMDTPTSWGLDTRRSFEPNHCKMSSSSGQHNSLPPLQQAIPEFHSHNPQERRESSIPRKLAEHSPTFKSPSTHQTHQHSHSHPAYPPHRISPPSKYGEASPAEVYDAQTYLFPDAHARRMSTATTSTTSTQPPYHQPQTHHPSPYLPPVSSMTSSRGSSLDMEPSENPYHPHRYTTTPSSTSPTSYRAPSPPYYGTPHTHHNSPDFERPGKRRRGNLPKQVTDLLRAWLNEHLHHPYPTEDEKQMLMAQTGLTIHQISNWFINARRRRLPAIASTDKGSSGRRPSSGQL